MFLTRCKDTTKKNSLYYTSRIVRDIVMSNEERIKIINTGTFQMVVTTSKIGSIYPSRNIPYILRIQKMGDFFLIHLQIFFVKQTFL